MLRKFFDIARSTINKYKLRDQSGGMQSAMKTDEFEKVIRVRRPKEAVRMNASFMFPLPTASDQSDLRQFNINRLVSEPVGEALSRLQANIIKRSAKSMKQSDDAVGEVEIQLFDETSRGVDLTTSNDLAWVTGGQLRIGDVTYLVKVNSPEVVKVTLPSMLASGLPVLPHLELLFCEAPDCRYRWTRLSGETLSESMMYVPTVGDVGQSLRLLVTPSDGHQCGEGVEVVSAEVVKGPEGMPFINRQLTTSTPTSKDSFRTVSYNVLAEVYTDSDFSRTELFAHCPSQYLDFDYRKPLLAKELLGYNSDIICLQEVDSKHFNHYFQPLFDLHGYKSSLFVKRHYRIPEDWNQPDTDSDVQEEAIEMKQGDVQGDLVISQEGSAIMFKTSKFRQLADCSISVAEALQNDADYSDLLLLASSTKLVVEKLLYRSGCILQVLVLEDVEDPSRRLCVCNTHLYFHPAGSVVRLLQMALMTRHLQKVKDMYTHKAHPVSVVLSGDFNSSSNSATIDFLRNRKVNSKDKLWVESRPMSTAEGMDLHHDLVLHSACGYPPYTNYVPSFKACIDYIFYEPQHLFVQSVTDLPSKDVMEAQGDGIPGPLFPSDHLALVCDLAWI